MSSNIVPVDGYIPSATVGEPTEAKHEPEKSPALAALGARLRSLRARRGMTRKELARTADVSERHLANLEYGTGNASFLVLLQV